MEFETNGPKLTHLVKSYYIDLSTNQLYSRYGTTEGMGIRKIKTTKKLLSKLGQIIESKRR